MLAYILTLLAVTASPDSALNESAPFEVDPIVVVGRREPVRLSQAVNSAITVSAAELRTTTTDNLLPHLAYSHSSISISSVNATGFGLGSRGQGKLLIRGLGFSPNRGSLVLIDGRPDIAGLFGHPLPDTYRRAGVYSAELVKGGASTLYGSNAIAGVLDIQSFYRPNLPRYTNVELVAGSYNTYNGIVQHSRRVGRTVLAGWYEYIESDNQRDNSEYFNRSGGFRIHFNKTKQTDMFISGRYTSFDFADAGPVYNLQRATGDVQRHGLTLGVDRRADRLALSMRLYHSYGEHQFSDGFSSVDRNNGLDLFVKLHRIVPANLSLSGGLSFNYLGGSAHNGTSFINAGDFSEKEYAVHLQSEYQFLSVVDATLGGRYINHDRYGDHAVYQAGLVISPRRVGSIKLSVGTAYRNPTVSETQLFAISNSESLLPEDGTFYEVGYFRQIGRWFSVETAVFWREGDNLITTLANPSPPPAMLYQNSGSYSHSGWEATLRWIGNGWSVSPSFTHLNQDDLNLSVPEDKFVLTGEYRVGKVNLALDAHAAFATVSDSATIPVVLDDYVVVNLEGRAHLSSLVDLTLRVENLFDREYQVVHGYPMPGIGFRLGTAVRMY